MAGEKHRDIRKDRTAASLTIAAVIASVVGISAWHIYTYGSIQWGPLPAWLQVALGLIAIPVMSYGMYLVLREVL